MSVRRETMLEELKTKIAGDVERDIFTRIAMSTDASIYRIVPECVVSPKTVDDVVEVVRYAKKNDISIIARGAGSGLAGEALGEGIVLNFPRYMNRIIGVSEDKGLVTVQPGVVLDELNSYLSEFGKKIGPDPSSGNRAAMGGVVANNATGSHSLMFGYIAEHIESLKVVTADGELREFGREIDSGENEYAKKCYELLSANAELIQKSLPRTKRNRSGYNIAGICENGRINMAGLMAGSEGSLAVITEITLRTVDVAKVKALLQLEFSSIENTARAVPLIVGSGAAACEMMDEKLLGMAVEALPQYADIFPESAKAILLVEHIGDDQGQVKEKIEKTVAEVGGLSEKFRTFFDADGQARLWKSRKDAVPLLFREKSDKKAIPFIEDVSVENSRLADYVVGLDKIFEKYGCQCAYYGHAGDGELHVRPYLDLRDGDDVKKMQRIAEDVFELAWSLGGTISGEHADGLVRAAFIKKQYGGEFYEILRSVKNIFDPDNILNPGKIINDDADVMIKNLRVERTIIPERAKTNLNFEPDEYRLEIAQCNGDGVCRSCADGQRMCPVFRATGSELACSRSKANLIDAWVTGLLEEADIASEEFKKILSLCINCKMCSIQCPSGVDISKLIIEQRAEYVKKNGLTRTEFALTHNRFMSVMGSAFAPLSNFVLSLSIMSWLMEKVLGFDRRRKMPAFERGSFIKKANKYLKEHSSVSEPVDKVVYFVDSYANYNDQELGFSVLKVLRHNDIEVVVPKQRAAPLPAVVYGDVKTARKDLEYIVVQLVGYVKDGYKVVCSEPSAALCLQEDVRFFVDSDDARLVSENSFELMSYLKELKEQGKLKQISKKTDKSFVYHLPCHLDVLSGGAIGAELVEEICGGNVEVLDCDCCGLAGTCGMQKKNFNLSVEIGSDMAEKVKASGADMAMTECAACKMQIEQLTEKKVIHPIKVIAKCYRLNGN